MITDNLDHITMLNSSFFRGDWGTCSCGWEGPERSSLDEASKDILQHGYEIGVGTVGDERPDHGREVL